MNMKTPGILDAAYEVARTYHDRVAAQAALNAVLEKYNHDYSAYSVTPAYEAAFLAASRASVAHREAVKNLAVLFPKEKEN